MVPGCSPFKAALLCTFAIIAGSQPVPAGIQPYKPTVRGYNGSFATQVYPGGVQQNLYRDAQPLIAPSGFYAQLVNITACGYSPPHFHPGLTEFNYVLGGNNLIAGVIFVLNGSEPAWATGLGPGNAATVPLSAVHYAENPTCGTIELLQVHSGLPPTYDAFPYVDLLTRDLALAAKSVQFSYGLTDAGLANAINTVEPLFGVNSECLAACDVQG